MRRYRGRHRLSVPLSTKLAWLGIIACFTLAVPSGLVIWYRLPATTYTTASLAVPVVMPSLAYSTPVVPTTTPVTTTPVATTKKSTKKTSKTSAKKTTVTPAPQLLQATPASAPQRTESSDKFGGVKPHVADVGNFLKAKFNLTTVYGNAPRPGNSKSDHPRGLALDLMVNKDTKKGQLIYACVMRHKKEWGVTYALWQVPDHFNHVHVSFLPEVHPTNLSC